MGAYNTLLKKISCGLLVNLALKWMKGIKNYQKKHTAHDNFINVQQLCRVFFK